MVHSLKKRLRSYALSFINGSSDDINIRLKVAHSYRVLREMTALITAEKHLQSDDIYLEIAALLHDWSRFEQICTFHTFNDSISFDHGKRSAVLVEEQQILTSLQIDIQADLLSAISAHNQLKIPENLSFRARSWCQALRDADKLDIMKLILHHLRHPENSSITFNLQIDAPISQAVSDAMNQGHIPKHCDMKSAADFLVGKLLWVEDLNFSHTRSEFCRRQYLEQLLDFLPKTAEVAKWHKRAVEILTAKKRSYK